MFKTLIIILLVFVVWKTYQYYKTGFNGEKIVNKWINAVESQNPKTISSLFCDDAVLTGTVSRQLRSGKSIKRYFDYFAKLPNIHVVSRKYNIQVLGNNICIVNGLIEWMWDGLNKPIIARMTFVIQGNCIVNLHSSKLPQINKELLLISGED